LDGKYKRGAIPEYWDGKTAGRIVKYLVKEWKKERADSYLRSVKS
jgi:hypothetical protein